MSAQLGCSFVAVLVVVQQQLGESRSSSGSVRRVLEASTMMDVQPGAVQLAWCYGGTTNGSTTLARRAVAYPARAKPRSRTFQPRARKRRPSEGGE